MVDDIERKCLEDIKGMLENYMKLVEDLSKMGSKKVNELNIDEALIKIIESIWIIENRFYDIEVKKAKQIASGDVK